MTMLFIDKSMKLINFFLELFATYLKKVNFSRSVPSKAQRLI